MLSARADVQAVAAADLVESPAPPSLPPTGPKSLRFLAVGDWGKDNVGEYADADGMETIASKIGANFTVMLGDNFYTTGIHGDAHSPRFENGDAQNGRVYRKRRFEV